MKHTNIKADRVTDTRGLEYPLPLVKTQKAMQNLQANKILEIWCADSASIKEIVAMTRTNGFKYLGAVQDPDGFTRVVVEKKSKMIPDT